MKILLVNKFYYPRGGDCIYTLNLEKLLIEAGHEVAIFSCDYSANIEGEWNSYFPAEVDFSGGGKAKLKAACRTLFGSGVRSPFNRLIDSFQPDIVHLNNIHSYLSPLVAEIAKKRGIPVVWTLHDYKLLCPSYACLKRGALCELCFTDKFAVLRERCMKNSLPASLIGFAEAMVWSRQRIESITDCYICPSLFMQRKMQQGGFDVAKLHHLANFAINLPNVEVLKSDYYCYIGRLSQEKGVKTLLEAAMRVGRPLLVIGGGPLLEELRSEYASDLITFTGALPPHEALQLVAKAQFSVIPSAWYENNPLSVIESLCMGTPVLGANIGGIPELIESGVNGLLFQSGSVESLTQEINRMFAYPFDNDAFSIAAQERFNSTKYITQLTIIYQQLVKHDAST